MTCSTGAGNRDRCNAVLAEVRRTIHNLHPKLRMPDTGGLALLHVGCWDGEATIDYARRLEAQRFPWTDS